MRLRRLQVDRSVPRERARIGEIALGEDREWRRLVDQQRAEREHDELRRVVADIDDESLCPRRLLDMVRTVRGDDRRQLEVRDVG